MNKQFYRPYISARLRCYHQWLALAALLILSIIGTWPLFSDPARLLHDLGDPLLNSWILWWDVESWTSGRSWFDAPMFFPHHLTLAYSEHLLTSALLMLPLLYSGVDPLLAHNILFLLTFVFSGWGAYLLAYDLTASRGGAALAALAFAFSCFRFGQLGHVQILSMHFMPFILLILHRWSKKPTWSLTFLWALAWLAQINSCGYHGLFISLTVGLFLLFYGWQEGWWFKKRAWMQLFTVALLLGVVLIPLYLPYKAVKEEFGFVRDLSQARHYSASLSSYLAAPPANLLYGEGTRRFLRPEGELFLGVTLTCLVLWSFLLPARNQPERKHLNSALIWALLALGGIFFLAGGGTGGLGFYLPLTLWGLSLFWAVCSWRRGLRPDGGPPPLSAELSFSKKLGSRLCALKPSAHQIFYLLVAGLAFWASLGPKAGLYAWLYNFLPGFDLIRVPARFAALLTLAWAILAAFGWLRLRALGFSGKTYGLLWLLLACLILLESNSLPLPLKSIPSSAPPVYNWLAEQSPRGVVLELPALGFGRDSSRDTHYLYWATHHRHILVNGYSGFFPPAYEALARQLNAYEGDVPASLNEFQVDWLVLHLKEYHQPVRETVLAQWRQTPGLKEVYADQGDYVFAIE